MVEFKRKKGESFESFLRRFNKKLQQSRYLREARERQFRRRKLSRNLRRKITLTLKQMREKREYLRKIGKLKDE